MPLALDAQPTRNGPDRAIHEIVVVVVVAVCIIRVPEKFLAPLQVFFITDNKLIAQLSQVKVNLVYYAQRIIAISNPVAIRSWRGRTRTV